MAAEKTDPEEIFSRALEKTNTAERDAYLDGACGDDEALRARVEALLKAHGDAGSSFLNAPTADVKPGEPVEEESAKEGPGTKIGKYKLLQLIGEGGFGTVYMAEQEEPVRRKVALKIIKLGMDTKQVIARFESERQALAMMDHPHIAKVLDAGATPTGRPYFVMELVRGVPLTEYCDTNNLSTAERLELFVSICSAIQHAHQKGIIHRDVKPSNVMVTLHDSRPVPKVIDFGIAKATNQRLTEKTLFTEYRQFVGTPEYMSPEQAEMSGLDIDTRSDIYSLGVLLYELLTGTTPFDREELLRAGYVEITRIIREEEPPTPSTRLSMLGDALSEIARHRKTEPGALSRLMRGDLDWIVMKALEKDCTRRYETASALASDVERHSKNEPVLAGPPSATYKLIKFVRRNRTAVVAGSFVAAALLIGLSLAAVGFRQAMKDRDSARKAEARAVAEAERSREIIESLQQTLAAVDPDRVKGLGVDAQGVLAIAREVVAEASPMPVPFGQWAELDALRAVNWAKLAEAVGSMNVLFLELTERTEKDLSPTIELQNNLRRENNKLVKLAAGVMGQIPSHSPINGEYTHPLVLINLTGALLERAELPFSRQQKVMLAGIGQAFESEYERRQATYTDETLRLEKLMDELELKRDCMNRVEDVLTPAQCEVVIHSKIHHRVPVDVLSPVQMVQFLAKTKEYVSKEQARERLLVEVGKHFEIVSRRRELLKPVIDTWYREVMPLLVTASDENEFVHLDHFVTAGRAHVHLLKGLLALPDLEEETRQAILADCTWLVPRVTQESIEETRKSLEALRRRFGNEDRRFADKLDNLARILEARHEAVEAISVLTEAIGIYRKTLGDSWNPDPLRYRLRELAWGIAVDPAQSAEKYEIAGQAAETVLALKTESATSLKTLGVIQYRLGKYDEAVKLLSRADEIHSGRYEGGVPADLAFLAMAYQRLGQMGKARATLGRLRELMQSRQHSEDGENQRMFAEAESLFEGGEFDSRRSSRDP